MHHLCHLRSFTSAVCTRPWVQIETQDLNAQSAFETLTQKPGKISSWLMYVQDDGWYLSVSAAVLADARMPH